MTKAELKALCQEAAEAAGKNAGVAPQLLFGDIYLAFSNALGLDKRDCGACEGTGYVATGLPDAPHTSCGTCLASGKLPAD